MNPRHLRWLSRTRPPAARTGSWRLTRGPTSAGRALHLAHDCLHAWKLGAHGRVFELLVGELVADVLEHTGGTVRLTLFYEEGLLRCAIEEDDPGRTGERGLYLVAQLSCCWGSTCTPAGKATWFELPVRS
ncbi:ATP-binding protein [Nonomuraea typhae]|uniref:ATP-binding protein n=1 Tax=Nonomuraea typhae TaxID=2603600 RepID=UPI0012F99799|nr:ATP-binding protein [Nonomuraea typhae]